MMKEHDHMIEGLENVQRVEAPPFLLTRIESRIETLESNRIPLRRVVAFGCMLAVVLGLNAYFLVDRLSAESLDSTSQVNLVEAMGLSNPNQLYYE